MSLENIINGRMNSTVGLQAYAELQGDFSQETFDVFSRMIYDDKNDLVKNITF